MAHLESSCSRVGTCLEDPLVQGFTRVRLGGANTDGNKETPRGVIKPKLRTPHGRGGGQPTEIGTVQEKSNDRVGVRAPILKKSKLCGF